MSYLYGDSGESPLTSNFIDLVRDALDTAVAILLADERMRENTERLAAMTLAGEKEMERLAALATTVTTALHDSRTESADSARARCADAIARSTAELVRGEVEGVRAHLSTERARVDAQAAAERQSCLKALERLLLAHDLPQMETELRLVLEGGARYLACLQARTPWGVTAEIELEIPATHVFAQPLRVEKLIERLEVQAPEAGGWLRKEIKLRPQRLDKAYLTELAVSANETTVKLRDAADGKGPGFDIVLRGDDGQVRMVRIGDGELPPFELADVDGGKVQQLEEKLYVACTELRPRRRALRDATLDGVTLRVCERPRRLIERLITIIAPTVQEIARRAQSPGELVLKKQLSDGVREEIFISKEQLRQKLIPLPSHLRALFDPLGLDAP